MIITIIIIIIIISIKIRNLITTLRDSCKGLIRKFRVGKEGKRILVLARKDPRREKLLLDKAATRADNDARRDLPRCAPGLESARGFLCNTRMWNRRNFHGEAGNPWEKRSRSTRVVTTTNASLRLRDVWLGLMRRDRVSRRTCSSPLSRSNSPQFALGSSEFNSPRKTDAFSPVPSIQQPVETFRQTIVRKYKFIPRGTIDISNFSGRRENGANFSFVFFFTIGERN